MLNLLRKYTSIGLLITLLTCLSFTLVLGQGDTPARGFQPGGAYSLSDIESINTNFNNGNLMFNFPLGKLPPGRAGLSAIINLHYNSKIYDSHLEYYEDYEYTLPPDHINPTIVQRNLLWESDSGGWKYGIGYNLILVDRVSQYYQTPTYGDDNGIYRWKVKMSFPDGSIHEFLPRGFGTQGMGDGYYNFRPDGWQTVWSGTQPGSNPTDIPGLAGATHYYTFDGSYLRLDIEHDSNGLPYDNPWTLTFPDGTRVTQSPSQPQRVIDRNGNYTQIEYVTFNGHPATRIVDQMGRQTLIESTPNNSQLVHSSGPGGADVAYEVVWKLIQVGKTYRTVDMFVGPNPNGYPQPLSTLNVVSEIRLPSASGNLKYIFGYNAPDYGSVPWGTPSVGLGEVNSLTLPSGAQVQYQYTLDNQNGPADESFTWDLLLKNAVSRKTLNYQEEYDGNSTPTTETWNFPGNGVVNPDGAVVTQNTDTYRVYQIDQPDGKRIENVWASNMPQGFPTIFAWSEVDGFNPYDSQRANGFIKWQLTSIRDSSNNFVKTAIKEFAVDKNGNTTSVTEYDWVPYANVPRNGTGQATGVPAGAVVLRVTTNTLARPTQNSTDTGSNSADAYWNYSSPNLRNAVASTELSNGSTTLTREEFFYDNSGTTGNLTQKKIWDSTKGALTRPLTSGNSVSTTTQYDAYGNPTVMTDSRGFQTVVTYGLVNGFTNLYPTQTVTSSGTSVARTTTKEFDFATGMVTRVTDVDNNVSSSTTYDVFGRPTLVKTAEGTALESRTATEYSDTNRRVIVRSDLATAGDGKLVTVQHFDQVGRIRLTRQLEDSATQSATDETTGVKTQTRYRIVNPCAPTNDASCLATNSAILATYDVVSNPYRAATSSAASSEPTMGWRRMRRDRTGRLVETQTFGSSTLPAPWGSSTVSTGTLTVSYDANFTTSTDQRGKLRRSMVDALGRLIRVDEPNSSNVLGSTTAPNQPTTYSYDARGNLISVDQNTAVQPARTFAYSSLGRLTSNFQPESGTSSYQYDDAGNVLVQTDARGVSTHFSYDALSRMTRRWYNGSSSTTATTHNSPVLPGGVGATAEVNFYFDSQSLPAGAPTYTRGATAGRLVAETYGGGSNGNYFAFDVKGKPTLQIQQTGSVNYQTSASYNLAGSALSITYPSGHTVTNSLDTAGRLSGMSGTLGDGNSRTYTTGVLYSPFGTQVKEQFGTTIPIYNKLFYNSRAQLTEIRESTSYTGPTDTTWDRGAIVNSYSDQCTGQCAGSSMTDNNGFLVKQSIYIPNQTMRWQQFDYDSLNRLNWAREVQDGGSEQWKQQFIYDRYGNRTIDTGNTYGTGINNKAFSVNQAYNQLVVPGGQSGTMTYDAAGNLTNDTYTGAGNRTYNAENKITSAWGGNNQAQLYTYDSSGNRIKRTVDGVETWNVYGIGGDLIAEYAANGAANAPQKEYGYRNGQLLITASGTGGSGPNSLSVNGSTAYAEVPNSSSLNIAGPITMEAWIKLPSVPTSYQPILDHSPSLGNEGGYDMYVTDTGKARMDIFYYPSYQALIGATTLTANVWHHIAGVYDGSQLRLYVDGQLDGSVNLSSPMTGTAIQLRIGRNNYLYTPIYFNGLIDEVRISTGALYSSNFTPATSLTASGSTKGLWKFDSQTVGDSSANGNNGTLNGGATYSTDVATGPSTSYYSGSFNGSSAYVEAPNSSSLNIAGPITMEAWIKLPSVPTSYQPILDHSPSLGNEGGYDMYVTDTGKARMDIFYYPSYQALIGATTLTANVWHHIAGVYDGSQLRLYVDGQLDGSVSLSSPMTGTAIQLRIGRNNYLYTPIYFNGLIDEVRISTGALYSSNFTPQTHLTAGSSTKGLWKFDGQTTNDSSGNGNNGTLQGNATYSADVPSGDGGGGGSSGGGGSNPQVQWLVTDHLGTPRIIIDQSGTLAGVKRHDYLPFGEELFAPTGGRTTAQGYSSDGIRQQFTGKERDVETQLDYSRARYYSPVQGRFTGPDPILASGKAAQPQSWNRYTYCLNAPSLFVDPNGLIWGYMKYANGDIKYQWFIDREQMEDYGYTEVTNFIIDMGDGTWAALDPNNNRHTEGLVNQWEAKRTLWGYQGLAPSWNDWVPIWGQTRQFLFNWTVGNYEHALINFTAASVDGGTMAAGFVNSAGRQAATRVVEEAGEGGVLRFSQVSANPSFSEAGDFAGETISSLATKVRAGEVPVDALKVGVVDGADGVRLIVNTRTSLALRRAGVPEAAWNIVDVTKTESTRIADRLIKNGLTNKGTDVLTITAQKPWVSCPWPYASVFAP